MMMLYARVAHALGVVQMEWFHKGKLGDRFEGRCGVQDWLFKKDEV